jgi:protein-L-isoaspartate(D-aspartate) O-methyltransferase
MNDTVPTPESLRTELVDRLRDEGSLPSLRIEEAFRSVPRHLFLPGTPVTTAYADEVVVTKRDPDGVPISSASQPTIIATMLGQADIHPGMRVLEIGAGTGYNAALLRELVGPEGQVTTIDIDPVVTEGARAGLTAAGYDDIHVICDDGARGDKNHAPYDRIVITTGAWDLPPAWWEQLVMGGRIVVPLRWRGLTRSIAFDHQPGHMVSRSIALCGFIPMEGDNGESVLPLAPDVVLYHDNDQAITADALHGVLDQSRTESWSGITVGAYDSFDGVWLRLSTADPATCRIAAEPSAVRSGRATPAIPNLSPALAEGGSLAYLATRRLATDSGVPTRSELGAFAHGPDGHQLADRICEQIRKWDRHRTAVPEISAFPAATPEDGLPAGAVIVKRHTRLVASWG